MAKKILIIISIVIAVISLYPYFHLLTAIYNYPFSIYTDEGTYIRKALVFLDSGISFNNLEQYPYFITIYGFLYELTISPLLLFMEPSVNAGRIITMVSTMLIIVFSFKIIFKISGNLYLCFIFSGSIIFFKLLAVYTAYSKNDMFLALLTLIVLYSMYFHNRKKQFAVTLIFTSLALMTKQTSIFIIPVVISVWFMNRITIKEFIKKSVIWISCLAIIFILLFLAIPNYYYNTIVITGKIGHLSWSLKHMIFSQTIPLFRSLSIYIIIALTLALLNRKKNIKVITPALLYIIFYMPIFFWTSINTGSMPVYYIFTVIGLSIYIPEQIKNYGKDLKPILYVAICMQLIIFLFFSSTKHFLKFYYPEPTETEIVDAREIDKIVREHDIENSFTTFSFNSFGLSRKSAKNNIDFNIGGFAETNQLDLTPYINDFNNKRFSVIVGGFDYPEVKKAITNNYYLYKLIGGTTVYLPSANNIPVFYIDKTFLSVLLP